MRANRANRPYLQRPTSRAIPDADRSVPGRSAYLDLGYAPLVRETNGWLSFGYSIGAMVCSLDSPKERAWSRSKHKERKADGQEDIGSAARDVGPHDPEDAARAGPAARVRHCAAHRAGEPRRAPAERGHGLHLVAAAATAGMDHGSVGHVGEQPQGEVLFHHRARPEAARASKRRTGSAFPA